MATIADELNAISVEHGYTGAAPKTIAGAIDALADTLAGTDVEERRTIAGAVKALAPYIGTGGGAELGPLANMPYRVIDTPAVGMSLYDCVPSISNSVFINELSAGSTVIAEHVFGTPVENGDGSMTWSRINSGTSATMTCPQGTEAVVLYVVKVSPTAEGDLTITSVQDVSTGYQFDADTRVLTFTMPQLADDELLCIDTGNR